MHYEEFCKQFNIALNEQQAQAVRHTQGAVLLLAVPGSGKTTALVARLGYMLYCVGVVPESILTMTYTVSAAGDMKKRFTAMFGDEYAARLQFRTINGLCASIINGYVRDKDGDGFDLLDNNAILLIEIYRKLRADYPVDGEVKELQMQITCECGAQGIWSWIDLGKGRVYRDMYDSLLFWGVPKIYQLGFGVRAASPDEIPAKILRRIHRETDVTAEKIHRNAGRSGVSVQGRFWFYATRFAHKHFKRFEPDYSYWKQRGWHGKQRPWKIAIKSGNLDKADK